MSARETVRPVRSATPPPVAMPGKRSREGSGTVRACAHPLVTAAPDASAIRSHLDVDLFGILGITGGECRTALGANALVFGQLTRMIDIQCRSQARH
jgi:hypothetical protein